jgi:hypothetical protein
MNSKENLVIHKEFISAVAKDLISPNSSNDTLKEILAICKDIKELNTVEVLNGCSDCSNLYMKSFNTILNYLNKK